MADEYLNGPVKEILEPMISALLIAQPEDPKFFMLHWLKNLYTLDYIIINEEKEELENLRLLVKSYKMKKTETIKETGEQPLEELKDKIIEKQKETQNEQEKNGEENKEKEKENNNANDTINENLIDTNKENKKETQSNNNSKKLSVNENKSEIKNLDAINKNENDDNKDLIDFSEESEK